PQPPTAGAKNRCLDLTTPALLSGPPVLAICIEGSNLTQLPAAQRPLVPAWCIGTSPDSGITANWILTYAPSSTPQKFYGPAHTERETVGPDCSLHITGLRKTDVGSYTLTVQGPGYNQAISMRCGDWLLQVPSLSPVRPLSGFLALIVGVPLAVLVCVALVTFILCKRRRGSGTAGTFPVGAARTPEV
uniref:Uncharacterized protein n=1 Tax=Chelonoidis abingdonii TaxID=106734 RepID=A0A8C0G0L0_CHEAB